MDAPLASAQLQVLGQTWRLRLDVRSAAGTLGVLAGRETGSSVEIQDFRDYVPGDDPRRIDWRAYGRTGRLVVRLFREEISPFLEILLDTSASMGLDDGRKAALAVEIAAWLVHAARADAISVRLFAAGEELRRLDDPAEIRFDARASALFGDPWQAASSLRRLSVRVLITDFLEPGEPGGVVRALASSASKLIVVHVLGPWEAEPKAAGPSVLESVESGSQLDIQLDHRAVELYRRRLAALIQSVKDDVFRCGGHYLGIVADRGVESVLRDTFMPAGIAESRG